MNPIFQRIQEAFATTNSAEIARKLGFGKHQAYKWRDGMIPTTETLLKVYELTGRSLHWLVTGEGEKFAGEKVTDVTKMLAPAVQDGDTPHPLLNTNLRLVQAGRPQTETKKLHAILNSIDQQIATPEQEEFVFVPSVLLSQDTLLFIVEGDGWAAEGLHAGDMLLVKPVDDPQNKLVLALIDGKVIVRHYERRGQMVLFSALEGSHPTYRVALTSVEVLYEISSLIHNFN